MAARGRRLLPRSLATSKRPPPTPARGLQPPPPAALAPRRRRRARPALQPTRCLRPRPSLAPPASSVPGANQTNNASPAALLPLPADRLASSHLGRSRSEPRLPAGAERTRANSGATW